MNVTGEEITKIVNDIWTTYSDVRLRLPTQRTSEHESADDVMTGRVFINGAWRGSVEIECSRTLAERTAASMLGGTTAVSVTDLKDALGELTNIISGNIKSLLPGPSYLSLPAVWEGPAMAARSAHITVLERATLRWEDQPVRVTVWVDLSPQ